MTRDKSWSRIHLSIPGLIALLIAFCGVFAMPEVVAVSSTASSDGAFAITRLGGHQFGSNSVAVWLSGKVRVGLSDTIDKDFNGVGILDAQLSKAELDEAKEIQRQLCKAAVEKPKTDVPAIEPATLYSVDCVHDGQTTNEAPPQTDEWYG